MPDTTNRPPTTWRRTILLGVGAIVVVGLAWFGWQRFNVTEPPGVDPVGVEAEIIEAIEKARAEVRAEPRSGRAWGHLGMVFRAHDFGDEANLCFAQAEKLDDQDGRWPYLRALTLLQADRDAAIVLLERAVPKFGRDVAPRLRLAEALFQQGRLEDAERHFHLVLAGDRANPRAHLGLARIDQRRDALKESLAHLRIAAASPLTRKSAVILQAEVRARQGDADGARENLRQAATLPDDPGWPDATVAEVERLRVGLRAQLARVDLLLQENRARDAVALLEDLALKSPDAESVHMQLGQTLLRLGIADGAERSFRRVTALTPNAAAAHFQLGNALAIQKKHKQAADCFHNAIELLPSHALAHYNLGHMQLALGDKPAAAAAFRAVLRYQPNYANAHINLGDLLGQEHKDTEALEHLEEALRLSPGDERATKLVSEIGKRMLEKKK